MLGVREGEMGHAAAALARTGAAARHHAPT